MANGDRLQAAHAKVEASKTALIAASKAAEAAREFAAEAAADLAGHVKRNEEAAAMRAAALKQAMRLGGASSTFPTQAQPAKDRLDLIASQDRQATAKAALSDLVAEQNTAQREADEAMAAMHAEARAILIEEGSGAIAEIEKLEVAIMTHRIELEGLARSGLGGWDFRQCLSGRARLVLEANGRTDIGTRNARPWAMANDSAEAWRQRYEALITNNEGRRAKDKAPVATAARRTESAVSPGRSAMATRR